MNALISGQAGVGVLIQGNDVSYFTVEDEGRDTPSSPSAVPYLFTGTNDVLELKATTRSDAVTRLKAAWRCDRALQLMLISLDGSESVDNRKLSIECIAELLKDNQIYDTVRNRLYAAPLPSNSDVQTAVSMAKPFDPVGPFLTTLQGDQPRIERVRSAWETLPLLLFGSESAKREFFECAVTSGAFWLLAGAAGDTAAFGLAVVQCHQHLMALPNYRKVLKEWTGQVKPTRAALVVEEAPKQTTENMSSDTLPKQDRGRHFSAHDLFENVKRQKQGIVEVLQKGDIAHVRTYAAQLMDSQLRSSDPQFAAMSLCDLAQEAKNVRNYSLQLELAQRAVEVAPEDGWAHGQVADAYFCLGQYDNALKSFHLAATFGQRSFAATGRARVLRAQGKLDESLAAYEQAVASFSDEPVAYNGRAEVLRDMWKLDQALRAYDLAIEKFPTERVSRCGRAAVLTEMGRLNDALRDYDRTIEDFGNEVVSVCGRADVLKQMGRLHEALQAYNSAIQAFPTEPIPRCGRADVLKEMGQLDEALKAFSEAADLFPYETVPQSGRAETFKRMGKHDLALASYEDALQKFSGDVRIRNGRADVLKRLGRLRESLQAYDENIKRSPYDIVALSGRADILKELGKLKKAAEAYGVLMGRDPRNQGVRNSKAAILVILRRYEDALQLLPTGDPQTHDEWVGLHIRGMVHLKRKKFDQAIRLFEEGLTRTPFAEERQYFQCALAVAKLRMKKFDQAVSHLSEVSDPLTNVLRMHALAGLQKIDLAQRAFRDLQSGCPGNLVSLRDEVAARYKLVPRSPRRDSDWIFDEECRSVLLEAA